MQAERRFRRAQEAGSRAGTITQEMRETLGDLASERPTRGSFHHHIPRKPADTQPGGPSQALWPELVSGLQEAVSPERTQDNCRIKETPRRPAGWGLRPGDERPCLNGARLGPEVCPPPHQDIGPDNMSP